MTLHCYTDRFFHIFPRQHSINLSECLGVQKVEPNGSHAAVSATKSAATDSFRRVKTFSGEQQGNSLHDLIHEAEYTSAALQALCQSGERSATVDANHHNNFPLHRPIPILQLTCSPTRNRSLSQGPPSADPRGSLAAPAARPNRFSTCQAPPKLKFGDPIATTPPDVEYIGTSPLSLSLLIEYLARVS